MKGSVYTSATMHPWLTGAILGATGVAVAALLGAKPRKPESTWKRIQRSMDW